MHFKLIEYISKINKSRILYKSKITTIDRLSEKTILKIIPKKVTPNHVTTFRFITIPILITLLVFEYYKLGALLFIISAFSDVIDGALARTKNKITTWGAVYDPIADKLLIGSVSVILISKLISPYLSLLIIVIEIMIILLALYCFKGEMPPAKIFGKLKGICYTTGIFLLIIYSLRNFQVLLGVSKVFVYLGLLFAILSPTLYYEMLKKRYKH
ncbi:MAG: CDP-alcohol phosphatidyltransferase family protein [Nanoarchaeota archaeon]